MSRNSYHGVGTWVVIAVLAVLAYNAFGHPSATATSLSDPAIQADINTEFGSSASCATSIVSHESSGNVAATNKQSGAYGLGQALPESKMAPFGADYRTNPVTQLRWMHSYVDERYRGACGAWAFWQANGWY